MEENNLFNAARSRHTRTFPTATGKAASGKAEIQLMVCLN